MKYLHHLAAVLAALLLAAPFASAGKTVIPVETDHTALVLAVRGNGVLETLHYGARIADPTAFGAFETGLSEDNGSGPMAYPTTGGRYLGEPALHVKYADGYHNTELQYVRHEVRAKGDVVTTEITLKDPVTALEVKLFYDAYQKEDVICTHAEIRNGGKKSVHLLNYASISSLVIELFCSFGWIITRDISGEIPTLSFFAKIPIGKGVVFFKITQVVR